MCKHELRSHLVRASALLCGPLLLMAAATGCMTESDEAPLDDEVVVEEQADETPITIAEVHPDDETTIRFVVDPGAINDATVIDTVIIGRDGGPDYGGLLLDQQVTPLELYRAIVSSDEDNEPEELHLDHERIVKAERDGDLAVRPLVPLPAPIAPPTEGWETTLATSTYSCNSFSNFKTQMGKKYPGAPGRVQRHSSSVNTHYLYSPDPTHVWGAGQAYSVVCNYNSAGNSLSDRFRASVCHHNVLQAGAGQNCYRAMLYDGQYLRRIYGHTTYSRRYWTIAEYKPSTLTSFMGIVRRD